MAKIIEIKGARSIHVRTSYGEPIVTKLKNNLSARWDADSKTWKISRSREAELLTLLQITPKSTTAQDAERLKRDRANLLGTAEYKGRRYFFVGSGRNERGEWYRLMFTDGSKTFFASGDEVEIKKAFRSVVSLVDLQKPRESRPVKYDCGCPCHRDGGCCFTCNNDECWN